MDYQRLSIILQAMQNARNIIVQCENELRILCVPKPNKVMQIYSSSMTEESILFPSTTLASPLPLPPLPPVPSLSYYTSGGGGPDIVTTPKFSEIIKDEESHVKDPSYDSVFRENVLQVLVNEFCSAKEEGRSVLGMIPPAIKSKMDPKVRPPKRSPHNESFTSRLSKIPEIEYTWIKRVTSSGSKCENERAYVLTDKFIETYLINK